MKSDSVVTIHLNENYSGIEFTKISDTGDKETNLVGRLGDLESGDVDIVHVLPTVGFKNYPNLKTIILSSRFDGDYGGGPGKGWYGTIKVEYSSGGLCKDFEKTIGRLKKTKPRARSSSRSSCPVARRPPCIGDWKHERKNNKGDDCCYKRPVRGTSTKPDTTLTIHLGDQVLYTDVKYPMRNHELYLLVQRTIRSHAPSMGDTISIQGVKDNGRWSKHHKVVYVQPSYNVTLRKLRGKAVTIQLSQGNVTGADILKAVGKAYRGRAYDVTKDNGVYIVSGETYRVSSLKSLNIVKKRKKTSRRAQVFSKFQTKWRKNRSDFKKAMIREGAGKRPCSAIEHPSNCMARNDCVYDSNHCRVRKHTREQHSISKIRAHQLAHRPRKHVRAEIPALLNFARGQRPVLPKRKKTGTTSKKTLDSVRGRFLSLLERARGNISNRKHQEHSQQEVVERKQDDQHVLQQKLKAYDEKTERERRERHARDKALFKKGKAARFIQQRWRNLKLAQSSKTKPVTPPKSSPPPQDKPKKKITFKKPLIQRRFEGTVGKHIAAMGIRREPRVTSPASPRPIQHPLRSTHRTPCACAKDSPCTMGFCHIDDSSIHSCKDDKVKLYVPRRYDIEKGRDERAFIKCGADGSPVKIRHRAPAHLRPRKKVIKKPRQSSRIAALARNFKGSG